MSNSVKILRNIAYSLIVYALVSALTHCVYAIIDYNKGILMVNVARELPGVPIKAGGFNFTNREIGTIEVKPTLAQSMILENEVFGDGGAGVVFYLAIGLVILLVIKFKPINIYRIEEQNIYQMLVVVMFLFFAISVASIALMNNYVGELTNGVFKHYDGTRGFSSLYAMGLIVLANAIYQFIVYTRKLKEENDLTI
jgi:hypothetical protein